MKQGPKSQRTAFKLVILLGIVSLFADMTYEGARSISGPYLGLLGASGLVVASVAGLGEFLGYGLRLATGYLADKTRQYWLITILGYVINLLAVPLLALAGHWEIAALFLLTERIGKAIRTPARDAILSHATQDMGRGWGFGLHEAMDQIGAISGPLIVSGILFVHGGYKTAFGVLLIPALIALCILAATRMLYPHPRELEKERTSQPLAGTNKTLWIYLMGVVLIAAGYADFPLIAFHFKKTALVPEAWIPGFYAIAMGADAMAALVFGRWFDKAGLSVLIFSTGLSAGFAPLVFLGGFHLALLGMVLWGIGMGAQESIMRAAIAQMVPADKRGAAYGVFNASYGLFWFLGSMLIGYLYDYSLMGLVAFTVLTQLLALPILGWLHSRKRKGQRVE